MAIRLESGRTRLNTRALPTLTVLVSCRSSSSTGSQNGVVDHLFIEFSARPIAPVSGRQGQWKLVDEPAQHMDLTFYPARRTYWSESDISPAPPWLETYAEWNRLHGPDAEP